MALIDYHNLKQTVQTTLQNDARTSTAVILIDPKLVTHRGDRPWVGIYITDRVAPEEMQVMAAGTRVTYDLAFTIVVQRHSLIGPEKAAELRDDYVGQVELVLMDNSQLGGSAEIVFLKGGRMGAGPLGGNAFLADAEVNFVVRVTATTT